MRTSVRKPIALLALFAVGFAGLVASFLVTPYMAVATFSYGLLLAAVSLAMTRAVASEVHAAFASVAVLIDLGLVLTLQLARDAVGTAAQGTLEPLQYVHVSSSSLAVLCFFPTVFLGWKALRSGVRGELHGRWGKAAFLLRTVGFISMFSMLNPKS